jgi:Uma2 family endonuclease
MTTMTVPVRSQIRTLADLVKQLGDIPLERIRAHPAPGTATEADLLDDPGDVRKLCELVDGTLVEKPMGSYESILAGVLIQLIRNFLDEHDLGVVLAPDGTLRLAPGLVRLADIAFIPWDRLPNEEFPDEPMPDLAPDLAVEILSKGNTRAEIERKLQEYFAAGTRLAWVLDPRGRTVRVHISPTEFQTLREEDTLDGGEVLPGFQLPIREWFERARRRRRA